MTPEITALGLALLLHAVLLCLYSLQANGEMGPRYSLGPRDTPPPRPLSHRAGRLQRAYRNSLDSLILFAPAVLMLAHSHRDSAFTTACAYLFVIMRLLYIPAYAYGLAPWRSVFWCLGFFATMAIVIVALV